MNGTGSIGLGVIGCGGFGLFALQRFVQVPGVKPVAMAGTHREAAIAAAARFGIPDIDEEEATRAVCDLFPGARLDVTQVYAPKDRRCQGRHKPLDAYQLLNLYVGDDVPKLHRYGELLRAVLADQLAWIRDRNHRRRITEQNGRESLATALAADVTASDKIDTDIACSSHPTDTY